MSDMNVVRKRLNKFLFNIRIYLSKWWYYRKIPLSMCSVEVLEDRYIKARHWHLTLSFWYLLLLIGFVEALWGPVDMPLTIFIVDIFGLGIVSVALFDNAQYKSILQLFIYMKFKEEKKI